MVDVEELIYEVRGAAMEVYNYFGPGLLESVYEKALVRELELRGYDVKTQLPVPIEYKGAVVGDELRIDILVEDELIVELKSVEEFKPVYYKTTSYISETVEERCWFTNQLRRVRLQERHETY